MGLIARNRRKVKDLLFKMDTRDPIVKRIPRQYRAYVVIGNLNEYFEQMTVD